MGLIVAPVAALIWVMYDYGLLSLENSAFRTWLGIIALSLVLGTGLSWSIVRRRLSGPRPMSTMWMSKGLRQGGRGLN